jgi:hypothetical protein
MPALRTRGFAQLRRRVVAKSSSRAACGYTSPMPAPEGFTYVVRTSGDVIIHHRGTLATTLRGGAAADFLAELEGGDHDDAQELMARVTGNYRRGNERTAKQHPRNCG